MNEERFAATLVLKNELPEDLMYACNGLVPPDFRLAGVDVNFDEVSYEGGGDRTPENLKALCEFLKSL